MLLAASLLPGAPVNGAAALASGIAALKARNFQAAERDLKLAAAQAPELSDYAALFLALSRLESRDYAGAVEEARRVWARTELSPVAGRAAMAAARAYLEDGKPGDAVRLLRERASDLPVPQGDALLASALELDRRQKEAALVYQRVYWGFPLAAEAAQAEAALTRLRAELGMGFPEVPDSAALGRGQKLLDAGESRIARKEFERLAGRLSGGAAQVARVRIGAADYQARRPAAAWRYLHALATPDPEADAERLYWLLACARRLDKDGEIPPLLAALSSRHAASVWRLKALVAAGNHLLVDNRAADYLPLYRACFTDFPDAAEAPYCHWKVTWAEYLKRSGEAGVLLREHLKRHPGSPHVPAALYYLGRLSETRGDTAAAKTFYRELLSRFPNYYYALQARSRLAQRGVAESPASAAVGVFLETVAFPPRNSAPLEPPADARLRLHRARLLAGASLEDLAEEELRFGARVVDAGSPAFAEMLAQLAVKRGAPDQGIRYIKRYAPGYLFWPLESVSKDFWRLAFPLPYRAELERFSRQRDLDPFVVAGLIRQESEFNPQAVSRAKAYGLTQVLPSTGRQLSRKAGIKRFSVRLLFRPEVNIQLGTLYLRSLYDQLQRRWEPTLASYNGGKSHVANWLTWAEFEEPSEFVETIPFTETRDYVQSVLRNADVYRRLYAGIPYHPPPAARPAAKSKSAVKAAPARAKKKAAARKSRPKPSVKSSARKTR